MEPFKLFFSSDFIIKWGFIVSIVLLGCSLYWCAKLYFGKNAAIISLLFYSVSVVQFLTFTLMYMKNVIGLCLMLFSIGFLKKYELSKRKYYLYSFIILAGILGAMHRATFYIFGLSYFFYTFFIAWKEKYDFKKYFTYVLYGVIIIAIALLFYIGRFWPAITTIIAPVAGAFVNTGESPGTFISFFEYQFSSLVYLPFALLGIFYSIRKKQINFLFIWLIINAAIVLFQLFFFNRFLIHLDIVLIIFAGLGANLVIQERKWIGLGVVGLLLIASAYSITQESLKSDNQFIKQEDIQLIEELGQITESNAIIMSFSSEYSPWILAYSNRTIIAPGLFDENKWDESEWKTFWTTNETQKTIRLMSRYDTTRPIYLYTGTNIFNNTCFNQFLEKNGRNVYEYNCQ